MDKWWAPPAIVIGGVLIWALALSFFIAGVLQWLSYTDYVIKTFGG